MKIFILCLLIFVGSLAHAKLSVMQGLTTDTATQVNFVGEKTKEYKILLKDGPKNVFEPDVDTVMRVDSPQTVIKLKFSGLKLGRSYELVIYDEKGKVLDKRHLKTLDLKNPSPVIAFASCMDDKYKKEQAGMWKDLFSHHPDLILLMGDNVYADVRNGHPIDVNGKSLWERYVETRDTLELYKMDNLVPILATWDDHDYGDNDGDKNFRYKKDSREAFDAFFSQSHVPGVLELGPGVSKKFLAFGQAFYLLDDRSFRTEDHSRDEEQTHWGKDQEEWLFKNLSSENKPSWLINGDQFFGGYHKFESYEGDHPDSFKKTLARLKKVASPVIFISGDRHLAELMKIDSSVLGYETYEFTTSAIHANVYPNAWEKTPNPKQVEGSSGMFNYGIVKPELTADKLWKIDIQAWGPEKKQLFEREVEIKR